MAPKKGSKKAAASSTPTKNDKGEIISWNGASRDGRELKIYVEFGCCDGLKPGAIREKFPQFLKYSYGCFNSALQRHRKSYNEQIRNRGRTKCLDSHNNLGTVEEEDDDEDEDDDDWLDDGVSRMTIADDSDDEYTYETVTDYSVAQSAAIPGTVVSRKRSGRRGAIARTKGKAVVVHGSKEKAAEYILDTWPDRRPRNRVSVMIKVSSGKKAHKQQLVRVSTNKDELVLMEALSYNATSTEHAFYSILMDKYNLTYEECKARFENHPKIIARTISMTELTGRNPNKILYNTQRIKLPYPCRHQFVTPEEDEDFNGKFYYQYDNGERWLHVELSEDVNDDFQYKRDDPTVFHARAVPGSVHTHLPTTVGGGRKEMETEDEDLHSVHYNQNNNNNDTESMISSPPPQQFHQQQQAPPPPVRQATVLDGGFEGAATRTRSVKSMKRTPSAQDDNGAKMAAVAEQAAAVAQYASSIKNNNNEGLDGDSITKEMHKNA